MVRSVNAEGSHLDHILLDYGHMSYLSLIVIHLPEAAAVSLVYLNYDRVDSRNNALQEVAFPLFKSLGHNGVVGVSKGMCNNIPCALPVIAALVEKYSHKFGNSESRVSVVDVDSNLVGKVVKSAVNVEVSVYDIRNRSRRHEILLTKTERLALGVVVIRIKNLCYSLRHDVSAESLYIVALVEIVHAEEARNVRFPEAEL